MHIILRRSTPFAIISGYKREKNKTLEQIDCQQKIKMGFGKGRGEAKMERKEQSVRVRACVHVCLKI